jgi:hypothetical protein
MNDLLPTLSVALDYGDDKDRGSKDVSRDRESRNFGGGVPQIRRRRGTRRSGVELDELLIA